MAAAGAFGVEGVDGAALEGGDGVLDEAGFVQRVGVDHHLDIETIRHGQAVVDRGGSGAPVLVQLQTGRPGAQHFLQRLRLRGVALAGEGEVDGQPLGRLQHARQVPGTGRAGGGRGSGGRAGAAAHQCGDARGDGVIHLLRTDEMNMRVDPARGQDLAFAGDDLGAGTDDDIDSGLDVRIAGLADGGDAAVGHGDVGFDDAPMVDDQRVGDDGVDRALRLRRLRLAHAVADDLAAAELHFLPVASEIFLHLNDQVGVRQTHAVPGGGAEHVGIGGAGDAGHQVSAPMTSPRKP